MSACDWAARALPWVLGFGVLLASLRLLLPLRGLPVERRPRTWRTVLLLLGQLVSVSLLFLLLNSPVSGNAIQTLHLLTAHAPHVSSPTPRPGEVWLRLPEAAKRSGATDTPDLATALRQHPGVRNLHLMGDGLQARDREAASGLNITFERAPLSAGITDWWIPQVLSVGEQLTVQGSTHGAVGAHIELLDPAGNRVDWQVLQDDGGFSLLAAPRSPGVADYQLRLRRADGTVIGTTEVPIRILPALATRLLLRSGGPDPELKFLRRWAADNGASLRASIDLGSGMQAGDPPVALDARTLSDVNVLILDDRSWNGLGHASRDSILAAVGDGLGLVLRAAAALTDSEALGLQLRTANPPPTFRLPATNSGSSALPALGRPPLRIDNPQGHTVLRDDRGTPLAAWRTHGRGRIAVWLPNDTFRLALSGHAEVHARLWANVINAVMRSRIAAPHSLPLQIYAGEATTLCGLGDTANVLEPTSSKPIRLAIDPRSGRRHCAAFWPRRAGWHHLQNAGADTAFLVRPDDADVVLRAAQTQQATKALAALDSKRTASPSMPAGLPRWPLFLLWLVVTASLWWFERSKAGSVRTPTAAG
jgi:hypothetical protein